MNDELLTERHPPIVKINIQNFFQKNTIKMSCFILFITVI